MKAELQSAAAAAAAAEAGSLQLLSSTSQVVKPACIQSRSVVDSAVSLGVLYNDSANCRCRISAT